MGENQLEIGQEKSKKEKEVKLQSEDSVMAGNPTPEMIIHMAIKNGVGVEQLEKLMDLQERWNKQQAEKAFNEAMNFFQDKKPKLIKSKTVDFNTKTGGKTTYNYIPLPKIQEVVDPVLSKFGLSYKWRQTVQENGNIRITCVLSHVDGHNEESWLESDRDTSGSKNNLQSLGSTVTYLKRYTLENALGLSSDEDDDGAGSEYTKEEVRDIMYEKLVDLFAEKEDDLEENEAKRINQIIQKKEYTSYKKAIEFLKKK